MVLRRTRRCMGRKRNMRRTEDVLQTKRSVGEMQSKGHGIGEFWKKTGTQKLRKTQTQTHVRARAHHLARTEAHKQEAKHTAKHACWAECLNNTVRLQPPEDDSGRMCGTHGVVQWLWGTCSICGVVRGTGLSCSIARRRAAGAVQGRCCTNVFLNPPAHRPLSPSRCAVGAPQIFGVGC